MRNPSLAASLVLLAACGTSVDTPTITVSMTASEILVDVTKQEPSGFDGTIVRVNGFSPGAPTLHETQDTGSPGSVSYSWAEYKVPNNGTVGVHVELVDDGDSYVLDAPDLGVTREIAVIADTNAPLGRTDTISVASNRAGDEVDNSSVVGLFVEHRICGFASGFQRDGAVWTVTMSTAFDQWLCDRPSAGSVISVDANVTINLAAPTSCTTDECGATPMGGASQTHIPVQLQF